MPKPQNWAEQSWSAEEEKSMKIVIEQLLEIGAIEPCIDLADQFLSPYFLLPKPDGSHRFILNLKRLNDYIITKHFKMEDLRTATKLLSSNDFMASIDLKDAYFLVPLHK